MPRNPDAGFVSNVNGKTKGGKLSLAGWVPATPAASSNSKSLKKPPKK